MKYDFLDSANRFENLFNSAPVGIFRSTIDGRLLQANPKLARLLGYASEKALIEAEASNLGNQFYLDPVERQQLIQDVLALSEERYLERELEMRPRRNHSLHGLIRVRAVRDENNQPVYLEGFIEDITDRKRAEAALREHESLLRIAGRTARFGGWSVDTAALKATWSDEVAVIHERKPGYAPTIEAALGYYTEEWREKIIRAFDNCRLRGIPFDEEMEIITAQNHRRWVRVTGEAIRDESGTVVRVQGSCQDINDRKQAESRKADLDTQHWKLQKTESLGRMAGAIAHNFNNQLQVLLSNLELASFDQPAGSYTAERLTGAMKACRQAADLNTLMLTYIGHTPGKKHEPFHLTDVCRRSLSQFETSRPATMKLVASLPRPGPTINANQAQIQQVLASLITNACEALPHQTGTIRVAVKTVEKADITAVNRFPVDWQPAEKAYACLEVTDSGCGISEGNFELLFDPFFTTKFTGRGLGLPVALGIVRAREGAVTVESKLNQGSAIRVFLPLAMTEATEPFGQSPLPQDHETSGSVLLVEDEDLVRSTTKAILKRLGFPAIEARDGVEAVDIFKQNQQQICFVLCDVAMPRMDGWQTLKEIKRLSPGTPVIMASGFDQSKLLATDLDHRPEAFLHKPYEAAGLQNAIREVLQTKNI